MDKNRTENDKINTVAPRVREVHRLRGAMPEIARKYGLWIVGGAAGAVAPAGGFAACPERYFEFYSLSHMYGGGGRLWTQSANVEVDIHPGDAILMPPSRVNRYGGSDDLPYIEDALQFCGPVADMLCNSGVIAEGVCYFGQVRKILPILKLLQTPSDESQIKANISLQQLLVELYVNRRKQSKSTPVAELLELIRRDPSKWWTVSEMAELCDLSDDQLRRIFVRHTGMRPKEYIEHLKLRAAAVMLLSEPLPVREIAARFGYLDPFHFSRRFKKLLGIAPESYRVTFFSRDRVRPGALPPPVDAETARQRRRAGRDRGD